MKRILITAFDAFGGHGANPSQELLISFEAANVIKLILPTVYGAAEKQLFEVVSRESPAAILMVGYSKTAQPIKLELLARNKDSKTAQDNLGQIGNQPIIKDGPETLASTLPIDEIVQNWERENITYELSSNAGGFLCNHVSYLMLNWLNHHNQTTVPCGFMHIGPAAKDIDEGKRALTAVLELL